MIEFLTKFWKPLVIFGVAGMLYFAIQAKIAFEVALAVTRNNAEWEEAIRQSNQEVEAEKTRAAIDAANRSRAAEAEITALRDTLIDLEKTNASLPKGDGCGLDAGRARLLNR